STGTEQDLPARDQVVGHAADAGITRERSAVRRRARATRARLAGPHAVANVPVVARRPVGLGGVVTSRVGIAAVGRARVVVRARERVASDAMLSETRLESVAHVAVAAERPVVQRRSRAARLVLAGFVPVARVAVVTRGARGRRAARGTRAPLAGLLSVARIVVAAVGAVDFRDVDAPRVLVARVDGALVVVVAVGLRAAAADPRETGLRAVALIAVAARRAVGGAWAGRAHRVVADLEAIADEAVAAGASLRRDRAGHAHTALTGVDAVAGL